MIVVKITSRRSLGDNAARFEGLSRAWRPVQSSQKALAHFTLKTGGYPVGDVLSDCQSGGCGDEAAISDGPEGR